MVRTIQAETITQEVAQMCKEARGYGAYNPSRNNYPRSSADV